jgi:hypothetical protein
MTTKRRMLVVAIAAIVTVVAAHLAYLAWSRDPLRDHYAIGSMNSVKLSIPREYLFFPVEYLGETVWAPRKDKPKRTYASKIGNFSAYVEWPTMRPRQPDSEASYYKSFKGESDWLMVSVQTREDADPAQEQSRREATKRRVDNGPARVLKGYLFELHRYGAPPTVKYEHRGFDEKLRLYSALPMGAGSEYAAGWNEALHWNGDLNGIVDTLIRCQNGVFKSPAVRKCEHRYELPALDGYAVIRYRQDLLPQWRDIETKTRQLFNFFALAEELPPDIVQALQE